MLQKGFFTGKTEEEILKEVRKEGFTPVKIHNNAGDVYSEHQHPETKLLAFLEGNMELMVNGTTNHCISGDKIIIPGNTSHSAVVGKQGCTFFWSEKL